MNLRYKGQNYFWEILIIIHRTLLSIKLYLRRDSHLGLNVQMVDGPLKVVSFLLRIGYFLWRNKDKT